MAWIPITTESVRTRISDPELRSLDAVARAPGQPHPLPDIIEGVVREVRGRVGACKINKLGPAGTIPDELEHHALAMVRYRLITRLPNMKALLDDARKQEHTDAQAALAAAARCEFSIEPPATPGDEPVPLQRPSITARARVYTRAQQDGI